MTCEYALKNANGRLICEADDKNPHGVCAHQKYCHQKCVWEISPSIDFCDKRNAFIKQKKIASEKLEPVVSEPKLVEKVAEPSNRLDEAKEKPVVKNEAFVRQAKDKKKTKEVIPE